MITLRPYQQTLIDGGRNAYRQGARSVLFNLPTGGGKTVTASTIVHGAAQKGNVVWWLCHRRELVSQASQTFYSMGIPHGTVQAGHVSNPGALVQVGSIQTVARRIDQLPEPALIVFDECVAGDSVVETDRGPMSIQDIRADGVKALCQIDGKLVFRTITKAWKSGNRQTVRICLSNGNALVCTPDHRIYLDGKWIEAKDLQVGQMLASPAAFASADAEHRYSETSADGFADLLVGTEAYQAPDWIGNLVSPRLLPRLRSVLAGVASKWLRSPRTQTHSVNGGAGMRNTVASFLGMTNVPTGTASNSMILSDQPFSAHSLGTGVSGCQIRVPQTHGSLGHTARPKQLGSITRALPFGASARSWTLPATLDLATSVFGCTLHVCLASLKFALSSRLKALNASLANGWMLLAMSGLHGGIATMAIGPTQCSFTPRDIAKRKTPSSRTGSAAPQLSMTSADAHTFASTRGDRSKSSNASGHSCQNAWDTNCPRIERIEAGPKVDVFDLTVDEAHNFFANGVLVHNCHHIGAQSWDDLFYRFPRAKILGLSATPWRLDGQGLGRWFDDMIVGPTVAELIEAGALSPYRLFAPSAPDLSGVGVTGGDYQRGALSKAMDRPQIVGDAIGHYSRLCAGKRAVVFAAGVENSKHIVAQFNASGIRAEHVDGSMSADERDGAVNRFKAGETLILSNADLFGEGFDVPAIEAAILLRPTKSLSLYLQQVGRALRPFEGKTEAIILDHAGNSAQPGFGLPDDDREWSLNDREKRKKAEKGEVAIRQCDECFFVYRPAPKCPACDHVPEVKAREIEVVEGTLAEVTREKEKAQHVRKMEERDCHTLDDWQKLARERGYKPGWALIRWQARQGRRAA